MKKWPSHRAFHRDRSEGIKGQGAPGRCRVVPQVVIYGKYRCLRNSIIVICIYIYIICINSIIVYHMYVHICVCMYIYIWLYMYVYIHSWWTNLVTITPISLWFMYLQSFIGIVVTNKHHGGQQSTLYRIWSWLCPVHWLTIIFQSCQQAIPRENRVPSQIADRLQWLQSIRSDFAGHQPSKNMHGDSKGSQSSWCNRNQREKFISLKISSVYSRSPSRPASAKGFLGGIEFSRAQKMGYSNKSNNGHNDEQRWRDSGFNMGILWWCEMVILNLESRWIMDLWGQDHLYHPGKFFSIIFGVAKHQSRNPEESKQHKHFFKQTSKL